MPQIKEDNEISEQKTPNTQKGALEGPQWRGHSDRSVLGYKQDRAGHKAAVLRRDSGMI